MQTLFTGDPSATVQYSPYISIRMHCCRYWWLKNWKYNTFLFPFRRIYHSTGVNGVIEYRDTTYRMETNKVYLIAPNTDYSLRIGGNSVPRRGNCLCGGNLGALAESERGQLLANGAIGHSLIHSSLGFPYDSALKGVFPIDLTRDLEAKIDHMQRYLLNSGQISTFGIGASLDIQVIIYEILLGAEESQWKPNTGDVRIAQVISYIEDHCGENLSDELLTSRAYMTTNSFSRLFKSETGVILQKFVKRKRIDYACMLITHTGMSIEEIATKIGFSNRFHFTHVFCEVMKVTPGKYRDLFLSPPVQKHYLKESASLQLVVRFRVYIGRKRLLYDCVCLLQIQRGAYRMLVNSEYCRMFASVALC